MACICVHQTSLCLSFASVHISATSMRHEVLAVCHHYHLPDQKGHFFIHSQRAACQATLSVQLVKQRANGGLHLSGVLPLE